MTFIRFSLTVFYGIYLEKYDNTSEMNTFGFDGLGVKIVRCLGLPQVYEKVFSTDTQKLLSRDVSFEDVRHII